MEDTMHNHSYPSNFQEERFGPLLPFVGGLVVGGLFAPGFKNNQMSNNQPVYGPAYYPAPAPYYPQPVVPYPVGNPVYIDPTNVYVDQIYQGPYGTQISPQSGYPGPYTS